MILPSVLCAAIPTTTNTTLTNCKAEVSGRCYSTRRTPLRIKATTREAKPSTSKPMTTAPTEGIEQ